MKRTLSLVAASFLSIAFATATNVHAQSAELAPDQISGATLQAWIEQDGLAVGGVGLRNGCYFMAWNPKIGATRQLAVFCPGSTAPPFLVAGEGKVSGNRWCSKFQLPGGGSQDRCEEFFKIGENKYETRVDGQPINHLHRLLP